EAHGPCEGKPRMTAASGGRAHRPNRLTRPRAATAARWVDERRGTVSVAAVHVPCHWRIACRAGSSDAPAGRGRVNRQLRRRCHILIEVAKRGLIVDDEQLVVEVLKEF